MWNAKNGQTVRHDFCWKTSKRAQEGNPVAAGHALVLLVHMHLWEHACVTPALFSEWLNFE